MNANMKGVSPGLKKSFNNQTEMYSIDSSKLTYNNNYNTINKMDSIGNYDSSDKDSSLQYKMKDYSDDDFKRNRRLITKSTSIAE